MATQLVSSPIGSVYAGVPTTSKVNFSQELKNAAPTVQLAPAGQVLPSGTTVVTSNINPSVPTNLEAQVTREVPNNKKDPAPPAQGLVQNVLPKTGQQPANTPEKRKDSDPFPKDTYRFGGGITSETTNARTLGEREERPENLANITITADFSQVTDKSNPFAGFKGKVINAYNRFFLQGVAENKTEKYQVVETFTSFYTFFYGKRPSVYRFSGALLNDPTNRWANDFMFFYENYLRGTRTADFNGQAIINYDTVTIFGYILSIQTQKTSDIERYVPFAMDVLVVDEQITNFSDDIADLITKKQAELKALNDAIQQQIALVSKNVKSQDALAVKRALTGGSPPVKHTPNKDAINSEANNVPVPTEAAALASVTSAQSSKVIAGQVTPDNFAANSTSVTTIPGTKIPTGG